MYGKIVDASGNTVVGDADADMQVPRGGKLSRRQCITLCDSTAETECTPDIYRVTLLRTAVFACQSNTPLRFLMPCRSGLRSLCSAGRQSTATTQANRNRVFSAVHVSAHLWVRAFGLRLRREYGGGKIDANSL